MRSRIRTRTYITRIYRLLTRSQLVCPHTRQPGMLGMERVGCAVPNHYPDRADDKASMNFFNGTGLGEGRTLLAVYPMCLFFFVLAWMIMIQ